MKPKILLFLTFILLLCNRLSSKDLPGTNMISEQDSLTVLCSPELYNLTTKWADEYCRINPAIKINVYADQAAFVKTYNSKHTSKSLKTVGLFRVDIFIPILTYIYGQAFLKGNSAVTSLYRLNNERYGMPMDGNLLLERLRKEVIHELGHTFGLMHCHVPACVMNSSTYVEDIDQKSAHLCSKCRIEMEPNPVNT